MGLSVFSLRSILPRLRLGTPKVFRIFGGCGTRPAAPGVGAQTSSPSRYCPPTADIGIPENPKAALAKIDIRCENRQSHYFFAFLLSYFPTFLLLCGCSQKPYYKETRLLMGTFVEITCQDKKAIDAAFEEIRGIETIANNFDPASEISRLNREDEIKASVDLLAMVRESLKYYRLSQGAFDITVGPLVKLWKERIKQADEGSKEIEIPSAQEISAALASTGADKIIIDETSSLIKFSQPGMEIDLGGIAKGYAVDKAVKRLKDMGITSAMVNAGGNIYCLGKKHSRKWRIGIQHPRKPQEILFYLELEDQAVATSGDYQQYFYSQGRRYSHIIDPKTGYPVDNRVISATIIALDGTASDALSTAVFVLGKEKGKELVKGLKGVEVRIVEGDDVYNN